LWAEFAINFGIVCSLLIMIGLGAGFVVLDRRLPRAFVVGGTAAILGAILPAYMIILLRGSLLQASGGLFVMLVSMALLGVGSKKAAALAPNRRGLPARDYGRYSPLGSVGDSMTAPEAPPPR